MIIHGDCLEELKKLEDNSIDLLCTDPPYGYSFMGKDWDKAVPSVEIWKECCRVLKPGAFAFVMSAPRSDVQQAMVERLINGGFRLDFTPIYWTYASGFPKAGNIGKMVDKRLGVKSRVIGNKGEMAGRNTANHTALNGDSTSFQSSWANDVTEATSPQAKALDGSYAGFQPKPAVEVIIVAMKPLSEKTFVDQALKNGKGVTWLDDCRIPTGETLSIGSNNRTNGNVNFGMKDVKEAQGQHEAGRFPANLLVEDETLGEDYSRFFNLDKWAETLPFLQVAKASKREKNAGTDKNHHPTVKPLKLMSYLITLGSRPGDTVLDPFVGSGTTVLAAKKLDRKAIGIEREAEYVEIAQARLDHLDNQPQQGALL